jgi:hypothetical protein
MKLDKFTLELIGKIKLLLKLTCRDNPRLTPILEAVKKINRKNGIIYCYLMFWFEYLAEFSLFQ